MTRLLALLLACAACAPSVQESAGTERSGVRGVASAAEVRADVALLLEAVETLHPAHSLYANPSHPTLLATREAAEAELRTLDAASPLELYGAVSRYLAALRSEPTRAEYPESFRRARADASHLPFRFVTDGERMWVDVAAMVSGLSPGDEIVAIEGLPVAEVIARVSALTSITGLARHRLSARFEDDPSRNGSGLEHFIPVLFGDLSELLLKVRRLGGSLAKVGVSLVSVAEWRSLTRSPPTRHLGGSLNLGFPLPEVALLRIDSFATAGSATRPAALYRSVLANLASRRIKTLILDVRANPGGSLEAVIELLRALSPRPFRLVSRVRLPSLDYARFAPHLERVPETFFAPNQFQRLDDGGLEMRPSAAPALLLEHRPLASPFRGDLIALTSAQSATEVVALLSKLRDLGRVILVGEPTGGDARVLQRGAEYRLRLPYSGIVVRFPAARLELDVEADPTEPGVQPHSLVVPTLPERLADRDPALEHALAIAIGAAPPPRPPPPAVAPAVPKL